MIWRAKFATSSPKSFPVRDVLCVPPIACADLSTSTKIPHIELLRCHPDLRKSRCHVVELGGEPHALCAEGFSAQGCRMCPCCRRALMNNKIPSLSLKSFDPGAVDPGNPYLVPLRLAERSLLIAQTLRCIVHISCAGRDDVTDTGSGLRGNIISYMTAGPEAAERAMVSLPRRMTDLRELISVIFQR